MTNVNVVNSMTLVEIIDEVVNVTIGVGGHSHNQYLLLNCSNDPLTGELQLRTGGAGAGQGPLRFAPGTLLTTPEAGVMEFDGTGIYLTPTNHRRFISLASDSVITTGLSTTVAPTTLWTGIVNANELKTHRVYNIKGSGLYNTANANDRATITIATGATTLISLMIPKAKVTNLPWSFEAYFTIRSIGVGGTLSTHGEIEVNAGTSYSTVESVPVNTTLLSDVTVVCSWDVANADNWLKLTQCWMATAD